MPSPTLGWSLICTAALLTLSLPAEAQKKKSVIEAVDADADFVWQGEYSGQVHTPAVGHRKIGLQVIALGDAKFDGVVYSGGLPGAGWDRARKSLVSGERNGAVLPLAGSLVHLEVQPTHAVVRDTDGDYLGTLKRIFRASPTLNRPPPPHALVLFDGSQPNTLEGAKVSDAGLLQPGVTTKFPVQGFFMHLEFRTPYEPHARGQGRGNSGVYIQRRYEVQILDSFGLEGAPNECGGLYRQRSPDVNMALPPLTWQTYDIYFTPARFDSNGKKIDDARLTLLHNGVTIHNNLAIRNKTGAGRPEGPQGLPIHLQDHRNPVRFRNVWLIPGRVQHPGGYCW